MRIAVVGAYGQLGTDLRKTLDGDVIAVGHKTIEIADEKSVEHVLSDIAPEFVINAAAYNFVDLAEEEPDKAFSVNALGPRNLAIYCAQREIGLLHVSTDFVFGRNADRRDPYCETDSPGPQSAYAVSKLAGEYFVRSYCPRHFVVRTCGLFGRAESEGKGNFVETMLRLGNERDQISVVNDQQCTPTSTADLAQAIAKLIETDCFGLYHATNSGSTNWCEFACRIFKLAEMNIVVSPISSGEFAAKATRPSYSVLDSSKLSRTIGWELLSWDDALARYLSERSR